MIELLDFIQRHGIHHIIMMGSFCLLLNGLYQLYRLHISRVVAQADNAAMEREANRLAGNRIGIERPTLDLRQLPDHSSTIVQEAVPDYGTEFEYWFMPSSSTIFRRIGPGLWQSLDGRVEVTRSPPPGSPVLRAALATPPDFPKLDVQTAASTELNPTKRRVRAISPTLPRRNPVHSRKLRMPD